MGRRDRRDGREEEEEEGEGFAGMAGVGEGAPWNVIRAGAPSAAVCLAEAVKSGTPSGGLRVVLEVIRPPSWSRERSARGGGGKSGAGVEGRGGGGSGAGGGDGAAGRGVLYRAIAVLVAANARSPSTRPVVVLTDLEGVWKLLWLGAGRSSSTAAAVTGGGGGRRGRYGGGGGEGGWGAGAAEGGEKPNVFVWRLKAGDAAAVVRSMLLEETVDWDGEVSWPSRGTPARHGWPSANLDNTGNGSIGGGVGGTEGGRRYEDGPLASLRERHLVGRRVSPRRGSDLADSNGNGNSDGSDGSDGAAAWIGIGPSATRMREPDPPFAMEMALRRGQSSFTGQSLPGQSFPSQDPGERESRVFSSSHAGNTAGSGLGGSGFAGNFGGGGGGGGGGIGGRGGTVGGGTGSGVAGGIGGGGGLSVSLGGHRRPPSNGFAAATFLTGGRPGGRLGGRSGGRLGGRLGGGPMDRTLSCPSNELVSQDDPGNDSVNDNGSALPTNSPSLSPRLSTTTAALAGREPSVLRRVVDFASGDGFLFVAGVSRSWRDAWGVERPPETSLAAAVQSPSRLGWARSSGCSWGPMVCAHAAAGGHLATLRYARAIGCPWDWRTCAHAASKVGGRSLFLAGGAGLDMLDGSSTVALQAVQDVVGHFALREGDWVSLGLACLCPCCVEGA